MSDGKSWDVLIIGAGPGGISAGIWAHRLGLKTLVVEGRARVGGQLNELHGLVLDYPGLMVEKGIQLAPYFAWHLEALGVPRRLEATVVGIDVVTRKVTLVDGEQLCARALILATGSMRRRLNVPGEDVLWGRGVSDSPSRDRSLAAGKSAIVIGGGDAALENARNLADICPKVSIVHRGAAFRARAEFSSWLAGRSNVQVYLNSRVRRILGEQQVTGVEIEREGQLEQLEAEHVFVKIGVQPRSELIRDQLAVDAGGYLRVGPTQETSVPGVYAVGDVCNPVFSSIANAVGQGMVAAKAIEGQWREEGDFSETGVGKRES